MNSEETELPLPGETNISPGQGSPINQQRRPELYGCIFQWKSGKWWGRKKKLHQKLACLL